MNSLLRIRIRVAVEQANQLVQLMNAVGAVGGKARSSVGGIQGMNSALKGTNSSLKQMQSTLATVGSARGGSFGGLSAAAAKFGSVVRGVGPGLIAMGKSVQWTGRQLEYNFTLPLVRAGRAIGTMMLENERALTRLIKVYQSSGDDVDKLSSKFLNLGLTLQKVSRENMTEAQATSYDLGRAFRSLSDIFGVSIDKVSDLGAMWAAAGAKGRDLAVAVRTTMEAMVIGDFTDQEEAFKSLIAIQQGYGLTMEQTRSAMAALNLTENITAANFNDLTAVVARAAGTARTAGVDIQHLAAMAAALVPATGSAESAGNALKTMFSRLLAPTEDARDIMNAMGVAFDDASFQGQNAAQRLETMAASFATLTSAQKAVVSSYVAGRYQLNRFDVLMADIIDKQGTYHTVLEALSDGIGENSKAMNAYRNEIALFLASSPQQLQILTTRMKNAAMVIMVQLMPVFLSVVKTISNMVSKFAELDPALQKFAAFALLALAAVGPIVRLAGSFKILAGVIITATQNLLGFFAVMAKGALAALTNPWVLLAAAIVAAGVAIYIFRDDIMEALGDLPPWVNDIFNKIVYVIQRAFYALPVGVQHALTAMVQVVADAAMQVYEWLQWMNPFAEHSPSLVDSVTAGVNLIAKKYASLAGIGRVFEVAAAQLREFTQASIEAQNSAGTSERQELRTDVSVSMPSALPALDSLFASLDALKVNMDAIGGVMAGQESVIKDLEDEYNALGRSIDAANDELDILKDNSSALKDELGMAQEELDRFANAPIQGMKAMSDAIFENEMAQKRLRLAMMDMEDATAPIEELRSKMALLAGEIEQMRGMQEDLRQAGAGSEITNVLDEQIDGLRAQQQAIEAQAQPLQDMQDELERLRRAGERLDLENSLKFDPLTRQIESMTQAMDELPFEQIVAGIQNSKTKIDNLTRSYDDAERAVKAQEQVIKDLTRARDAVNAKMDQEKQKLDELQSSYEAYRDLIRDVEAAIGDMASAARKAAADKEKASSVAEELFQSAAAGDFEPGDMPLAPIPEDTGSLKDLADAWQAEAEKAFADVDIFQPLKDLWAKFVKWWEENVVPGATDLWNKVKDALGGVDLGNPFSGVDFDPSGAMEGPLAKVDKMFGGALTKIRNAWAQLVNSSLWGDIAKRFGEAWVNAKKWLDIMWNGITEVTGKIREKLSEWKDLAQPAMEAFGNIATAVSTVFTTAIFIIGGALDLILITFNGFTSTFSPLWQAFWDFVVGLVGGVMDIIHGIIKVVLAVINGDWQLAWDGIKDILKGVWEIMAAIVDAGWEQIKFFFNMGLESIKGIWNLLKGTFIDVWNFITGKVAELKNIIMGIPNHIRTAVTDAINAITNIGVSIWNAAASGFWYFRDQVANVVNEVKGFFEALPGYFNDFAFRVVASAKNIGTSIMNGIRDGLSGAWNFTTDLAGKVWQAVKGVYNDVIQRIQNGVNQALDVLPWPINNIAHVNLQWLKMHSGGIVPGTRGSEIPTILQAGEAVLSVNAVRELQNIGLMRNNVAMRESSSKTTDVTVMNFHGDLSFPNIQSGDDAKEFVRNLKSLVPA
jgi:TP901 family phage tail tape measure protein